MTLAAPWLLLLGLFALVPLWLHLRRRKLYRDVPFAAMELARTVVRTTRRLRPPEDRVLLALRVAALLALALAAAGPALEHRTPVARADGVAIVLDDSASLRARDREPLQGTRFDHAREAALRALDGASPGVPVAAVLARPDPVPPMATGPSEVRALLAGARPTTAGSDIVAAARAALGAVNRAGARHPALVVATDATVSAVPGGFASLAALAHTSGATLVLPLGAAPARDNVGVTNARLVTDAAGMRVEAALGCYGSPPRTNTVRLIAGTTVLAEAQADCQRDTVTPVRLPLAVLPRESVGEVAVAVRDALPDDDRCAVSLRPGALPRVTVASSAPAMGGGALAEALRAAGGFNVRAVGPLALADAPGTEGLADVVALVEVTDGELPPDAAARLRAEGRSLWVVGAVPAVLTDLLPVTAARLRTDTVIADPTTVPGTEPGMGPGMEPGGGTVPGLLPVTARQWHALTPRPGARTLWTAGGAAVLVAGTDGPRRSVVQGIGLDERGSDLALRPAWVALAAGTAAWLAAPWQRSATREGAVTWRLRTAADTVVTAVQGPDGVHPITALAGGARVTGVLEPGMYRVSTVHGEESSLAFAVGIDPGESDLRPAVLPPQTETRMDGRTPTPLRRTVVCLLLVLLALEGAVRTQRPG